MQMLEESSKGMGGPMVSEMPRLKSMQFTPKIISPCMRKKIYFNLATKKMNIFIFYQHQIIES